MDTAPPGSARKRPSQQPAPPSKARGGSEGWDPNRPLTIASTGWQVGERVRARNKAFENSEMVLRAGQVPPSTEERDYYVGVGREALFYQRLADVLGHRGITSAAAAREWFASAAVDMIDGKKYDFVTQASDPAIRVEVTTFAGPKSMISTVISEENRDLLMGGQWLEPRQALELFEWEGKELSNWHRRRLFFMLTYWYLLRVPTPETEPSLPALDLRLIQMPKVYDFAGQLGSMASDLAVYVSEGRENRMFVVPPVTRNADVARFSTLAEKSALYAQLGGGGHDGRTPDDSFTRMERALARPHRETSLLSFFKSLLQKIVRLAPRTVRLSETEDVPAHDVLIATCVLMLDQSTFNPNGGGRETGTQALFKRAMIICYEDAWPGENVHLGAPDSPLVPTETLLAWATGMVALNKTREWMPGVSHLHPIVNALVAGLKSSVSWTFSTEAGKLLGPLGMPAANQVKAPHGMRQLTAYLLRAFVFGMAGDIAMLRHLVDAPADSARLSASSLSLSNPTKLYAKLEQSAYNINVVQAMPLWHAYDQHATPSLVFMFRPGGEAHERIRQGSAAKPYGKLFSAVFTLVTGRNPRRFLAQHPSVATPGELVYGLASKDALFVGECVAAQRDFYLQQRTNPGATMSIQALATPVVMLYPESWLAYLVGSHELDFRPQGALRSIKWIWGLSPDDLTDIRVGRDTNTHLTKPEQRQEDEQSAGDQVTSSTEAARRVVEERYLREVREHIRTNLLGASGVRVPASRAPLHALGAELLVKFSTNAQAGAQYTVSAAGVVRTWNEFRAGIQVELPRSPGTWTAPGGAEQINDRAYVNVLQGFEPQGAVAALQAVVPAARTMGISHSGIRMALARMHSFQPRIQFTVPGRDGGAARDKDIAPSTAQFEACQVIKMVAGVSQTIISATGPADFQSSGKSLFVRRWAAKQMDLTTEFALQLDPDVLVATRETTTMIERVFAAFNKRAERPDSYFRGNLRVGEQPGLQDHQVTVLRQLAVRVARHRLLHHFVRLTVGAGKTIVALLYFRMLLNLINDRRMFCLFATTKDAIDKVQKDAVALGWKSVYIKSAKDMSDFARELLALAPGPAKQPVVVFIQHDTLKKKEFMVEVEPLMGRALLVVDEVHFMMGASQRGERFHSLADQALSTLSMTATPLRSTREEMALRHWVQLGVQFPCLDTSSFRVALNSLVSAPVRLVVPTDTISHDLLDPQAWQDIYGADQEEAYNATRARVLGMLPERMGGTAGSRSFDRDTLEAALATAYAVSDNAMVSYAVALVAAGHRPWVVARDQAHADKIGRAIATALSTQGISTHPGAVWWYTSAAAGIPAFGAAQKLSVPLVGVIPLRRNTGYEATHFDTVLSGVYPSNQADRDQIVGRVARYGQPRARVPVHLFVAGLTALMLKNHIYTMNFNQLAAELSGGV